MGCRRVQVVSGSVGAVGNVLCISYKWEVASEHKRLVCLLFCTTTLNFKTESVRTSSSCWTKLCTKIIYTLLQAFVLLLQISYQKKSFLTTPNIENQSRSSAEFH